MSSRKIKGMDQRKFVLGELPLEMFEMVLNHVDNNNDLRSLRLVNSFWNSSVTSILQRRVLQRDTYWSPSITRSFSGYYRVHTPTLSIAIPESNRNRLEDNKLSLALFPVGITKFQRGRNPFPTNSLHLTTSDGDDNYDNKQRVSVYRLLQLHGHHLTSLMIDRLPFSLTPSEILKVLQFVPNLKVFNLIGYAAQDTTEPDQAGLPGSDFGPLVPKLTHAALCRISASFVKHLFKMFASQLIHLELNGYHPIQLSCSNYLSDDDKNKDCSPLKNLKELKVIYPKRDFLIHTEISLPLSLVRLSLFCPDTDVSIEELMGFIERFSSTIEDLGLILRRLSKQQLDGDRENRVLPSFENRSQVKSQFPRLSRFCVNDIDDPRRLVLVKNHLLPRFANLETLQLLDLLKEMVEDSAITRRWNSNKIQMEGFNDVARRFCQREGLWDVCPKLKSIQIHYYDRFWEFREREPRFDCFARRDDSGEN